MTDGTTPHRPAPATTTTLTPGQVLVASFRAARVARRPELQAELKDARAGLRQERRLRLGHDPAPRRHDRHDAAPPAEAETADAAPPLHDGGSFFAHYISTEAAQAALPAPGEVAATQAPDGSASNTSAAEYNGHEAAFMDNAAAPSAPETAAATANATAIPSPEYNDTNPDASRATTAAANQPSPPVSAMGFGPGMTIRFRHIGIETIADLAAADAASLRTALGDISRLINVDAWIASARNATA